MLRSGAVAVGQNQRVNLNLGTTSAYLDGAPRVVPFAHRGGAHHPEIAGLENSRRAFQHAHDLGYTYLETDVHVTADGVLVAFHDTVLDRVTDASGAVAELTWDVVARARIDGREPIPLFAELLEAFPQCRFNVDIKADGAVEPLVRVLHEHDASGRVLVGSFSRRRLTRFRRLAPEIATSAHIGEVLAHRYLPAARLVRWATPGRPRAVQVPQRHRWITVVTPGLLRRAHALGVPVHVWTVDDADVMDDLILQGVDGLMTDRTDILKTTLQRHALWKDPA